MNERDDPNKTPEENFEDWAEGGMCCDRAGDVIDALKADVRKLEAAHKAAMQTAHAYEQSFAQAIEVLGENPAGGYTGKPLVNKRAVKAEARVRELEAAYEEQGRLLHTRSWEREAESARAVKAEAERDTLQELLREWRDLGDVPSGGYGGTLLDRTDAALTRGAGE